MSNRPSRSTMPVAAVKEKANTMLKLSVPGASPSRWGVISMVEFVLHSTGNYKGFRLLPSELTPNGAIRKGHDDTRREYI